MTGERESGYRKEDRASIRVRHFPRALFSDCLANEFSSDADPFGAITTQTIAQSPQEPVNKFDIGNSSNA